MNNDGKTIEGAMANWFSLDDEKWLKHANPISVWTRYTVLPLIIIAFWSRLWIGWWCLVPGLVSILWMYFNPQLFPKARSTRNWASRCVLGERVFLNRKQIAIPEHHDLPIHHILNAVSSLGMIISIWAIVEYSIWGAVLGIALAYLGKSWFLDRMVWLYEDMKEHDAYKHWDY